MKNEFLKGVYQTFIEVKNERFNKLELNWMNNPTVENWNKCLSMLDELSVLKNKLQALN